MWHWLRSGLLKTLWGRLAVFSLTLHLFLLMALFLSGESSEHRSLDLSKVYDPQAKIVLLPFYRVVPAELNRHRGGGSGRGSGSGVGVQGTPRRPVYTLTGAGRPATTIVRMGPSVAEKRALAKKKLAEKRRVAQERAEKKAKLFKKQQAKKRLLEAKRAKIKEVARKKEERRKQLAAQKRAAREEAQLKKEKLKQAALDRAALEKAKLEKKNGKELENPSAQKLLANERPYEGSSNEGSSNGSSARDNAGSGDGSSSEGSGENIIYVGRDEIDQYRENTELRDALAAVWHPPLGIEPEKSCMLAVVVDNNGSASCVTVEASSGILVYDSAAQAALYETVFPEREHGKVLHITFR